MREQHKLELKVDNLTGNHHPQQPKQPPQEVRAATLTATVPVSTAPTTVVLTAPRRIEIHAPKNYPLMSTAALVAPEMVMQPTTSTAGDSIISSTQAEHLSDVQVRRHAQPQAHVVFAVTQEAQHQKTSQPAVGADARQPSVT